MRKSYRMNIAGCERELPLCPLNPELYIGAFIIVGDPELTGNSARDLLARVPDYDYLITAETKGIPLAHEMARQRGDRRYFVARKSPKLYMPKTFEVTVHSITTANEQKLYLDSADAELMKGRRILIVDDVVSTGESLRALETLVTEAGGNICGRAAILAEGDASLRDDIVFLEKLPLFDKYGEPID